MTSFSAIIIILAVIIGCVVAITVIQKREQQKAALRQKIAQYKYRANQAASILSNFTQQPIGTEARLILLKYSLVNLKAIQKLNPQEPNIAKSVAAIEEKVKAPQNAADNQKLTIPNDLVLLTQQVNQLSTLAKFILKINKLNLVPAQTASIAAQKIMRLISESKICAYIQQGKTALSKHEYVPAQRSFIMAQQMLAKVSNKDQRLISLESELQELIKSSPTDALKTELSFGLKEDQEGEEEEGSVFGPRKKW